MPEMIKKHRGFTLLEILVAIVILSLTIATASSSLRNHMRHNYNGEARSEASHAAQSVIDDLRYTDVTSLPNSGTVSYATKVMDDDRIYTVDVTYCANGSYCTSNAVRHVEVSASLGGEVLYTTEAVFTDLGATSGGGSSPVPYSSSAPSSSPAASSSSSAAPSAASSASSSPAASVSASPNPSPTATSTRRRRCRWWWC